MSGNPESNDLQGLLDTLNDVDLAEPVPETDAPNHTGQVNANDWNNSKFSENYDQTAASEYDYLDFGRYLNQNLSMQSIPNPYPGSIDFDFTSKAAKVRVVNTLLDLLQQRNEAKSFITEAQEVIQNQRLQKDNLTRTLKQLHSENATFKKKLAQALSQKRTMEAKFKKMERELKAKYQKVVKDKKGLSARIVQYKNEMRKMEKEIQDVKVKVKSQLDSHEKKQRVTLGMRAMNDENVIRRLRGKKDRRNQNDQLLQSELKASNDRVEELSHENQAMRHDLMTLRLEIRNRLRQDEPDGEDFEELGGPDVNPHMFEMPYGRVQKQIKSDVRNDITQVEEKMENDKVNADPGPFQKTIPPAGGGNHRADGNVVTASDDLDGLGNLDAMDLMDGLNEDDLLAPDPLVMDGDDLGGFGEDLTGDLGGDLDGLDFADVGI